MGGRGGGSGRTNSVAIARGRIGHLAEDYVGYSEAVKMLMKETGLIEDEAIRTFSAMKDFFGSYYSAIRNGKPPSEAVKATLIDSAIKKSRKFKGEIYRGIKIDSDEYGEWSKGIQKGSIIDMKGVSSWSSRKQVAENFAGKGNSYNQSVIFSVKSTKSAAPVQHLSHYGKGEAEVLAPSSARYKIQSYTTVGKNTYINLEEVG